MNPEQLRDKASQVFGREVAKQNLKTAQISRLTVSHRDGVFVVNPELFVLLKLTDDEEMVLIDIYDTPVMVNCTELYQLAKTRYKEVLNDWYQNYKQLENVRSAKQL